MRPRLLLRESRHLAVLRRAALTADATGFSKLIADRRGRLLGATLVGPAAGDALAELCFAIGRGAKLADISQTVHPYPTFGESAARASDQWWDRRYLNPRGRALLRPLLALLRALDRRP